MDAQQTAYMTEFISCWALLLASLVLASPVILFGIQAQTSVVEDLEFSDATAVDVL